MQEIVWFADHLFILQVKFSSASLQEYLKNLLPNRQALLEFFEVLLTIFKDHQRDDRFVF